MTARSLLAGAAIAVTLSVAGHAMAADPIETRQAIMSSVGAAAKVSGEMLKGNIAFSPDVAMSALATFTAAGWIYTAFFPEDSNKGDTKAKETIWTDRDGFVAASEKFASDAAAAMAAKPADLDAFKAAFGNVAKNCQSCHEDYRVSRN